MTREEEAWAFIKAGDSVGKRDAHEAIEAARENEYRLPSFGARLFMGEFSA